MEPDPGFYWVQFRGRWIVAEYRGGIASGWAITACDEPFTERDFDAIGPKILPPDMVA